jgi:hypothetical protein
MAFPVPPDPNSVVRSFLDVTLLAAASLLTHWCLACQVPHGACVLRRCCVLCYARACAMLPSEQTYAICEQFGIFYEVCEQFMKILTYFFDICNP